MRRLDAQLRGTRKKLGAAVRASSTTLTEVFGVGPVIAGTIIGDIAEVSRFPGRDHFAAYNGTAPVEVSSGNRKIYRLSLRGNRRINHASTWLRSPRSVISTAGRAYYDKKIAEGKTHKGALRSLKRRISDAIYARLLADAQQAGQRPARRAREGNRGTTLTPARPAHTPNAGSSDKPLPDPGTTIRPGTRAATPPPSKRHKENPGNHLTAATKRTFCVDAGLTWLKGGGRADLALWSWR